MVDIEKAFSLQSQGMLDEAKNLYLEFLSENPEQPDVSNLLGLIYSMLKSILNLRQRAFLVLNIFKILVFLCIGKRIIIHQWNVFQKLLSLRNIIWNL